ncbi:MAG TPA: multicopper oxidase domain-containing protein [Candidatus Nanopelagicales bacterium]|nr:multicopper oxidase domain-containing protein [Candidatus Nanopelagicales bacterium]
MNRTSWHLRAGAVVVAWLLALAVVVLFHRQIPVARWLMVHLLLLGAVTNAILIWSAHFAAALLRLPEPVTRVAEASRLALVNLGAVAVVAGVVAGWWPAVLMGGTAVAAAVAWHVVDLLLRMRASLPSRFAHTLRYYVVAGVALVVGVAFGVTMTRTGTGPVWFDRLVVAHALTNLLGWVALTVVGTLVTLWPTMLRTRIADGAEAVARRVLPLLGVSLAVAVTGALAGERLVLAAALIGYLAGIVLWCRPAIAAARVRPPTGFATLSVLFGPVWLAGSLVALIITLLVTDDQAQLVARAQWLTAPVLAGFVLPVLLGALSYLVPVVIGGGPTMVRTTTAVLDRGAVLRVSTANLALLVCVLPVPSLVRVTCSVVLLVAYAAFLPLLGRAVLVGRRRPAPVDRGVDAGPPARPAPYRPAPDPTAPARRRALAGAGLAVVLLATAVGVAADPPGAGLATLGTSGSGASGEVAPTGHTTTVAVSMQGMRFHPASVQVPAGDQLVLVLTNQDDQPHDLVLETGASTPLLAPGQQARLDVGLVGVDVGGWCSVAGHRQMGMVFAIQVTGAAAAGGTGHAMAGMAGMPGSPTAAGPSAAAGMDLMASPGPGFTLYDAELAPAPATRVHRLTLDVQEVVLEVAPGVRQTRWTFGGTAPGPTLRGRVGDVFVVTLVNDGSLGHSIDFHAGALAPDRPMRTIAPGERLTYRFTATRSGIWLYHCATMPMSLHIANGMFGAVVIDPPGLAPVDHEYLMVQSELYLGPQGGSADAARVGTERPDLVVFNGYAMQYDHAPLTARVGDRVRFWVLVAGPDVGTAFHVVGGQFDTVYQEGAYLLRRDDPGGSQALALAPAQGGFVELTFRQAGHYPFVSHVMTDAERGAHGIVAVGAR